MKVKAKEQQQKQQKDFHDSQSYCMAYLSAEWP